MNLHSKDTKNHKGFARTYSAQPLGAQAEIIGIEADITRGLHAFSIIGLPDKAVEEARDRISAAVRHSGLPSPKTRNERIVLSLSPADTKKEGAQYDVALAVAYLSATNTLLEKNHPHRLFLGELALDGTVRPVRGVLPSILAARKRGITEIFIPEANSPEASLISDIDIYPITSLGDILTHFGLKTEQHTVSPKPLEKYSPKENTTSSFDVAGLDVDVRDIKGQESAKRALLISAAGRHNIAFYGPPGTGKTLLARALCSILPPLEKNSILEVTAIHSTAGILPPGTWLARPPFRAPHHTSSHVALVGGGAFPRAGEVTLAHQGVLFLDEFTEFETRTIEALREPLEERVVRVSRARGAMTFPADVLLVIAMNPPGDTAHSGVVRERERARFERKVSQPIMDRIDLWVHVPKVPKEILISAPTGLSSEEIREKIIQTHRLQLKRGGSLNGRLGTKEIEEKTQTSPEALVLLGNAIDKLGLSPRVYHRTLRIARTIADLEESAYVLEKHMAEALQYRPKNIIS